MLPNGHVLIVGSSHLDTQPRQEREHVWSEGHGPAIVHDRPRSRALVEQGDGQTGPGEGQGQRAADEPPANDGKGPLAAWRFRRHGAGPA